MNHLEIKQPIVMKLQDTWKISPTNFYKHIKRQNFCQRRISIKPEAWKALSSEYLKQIRINEERKLFKTFKGFKLFAGDGSDFNLIETEELRKEYNVKNTMMKKKSCTR